MRIPIFTIMLQYYLGIDLGATKCAGAVITDKGEIITQEKAKMAGLQGSEAADRVVNVCKDLIIKSSLNENDFSGIGVSVPGIYFKEKGTVWAPNIPGWEEYPLQSKIQESLNFKNNISIDNDRACSIMGERWLGAALNCKNAIHLAFGTGIGAGIMADDQILRGQNDIAGSIGWMVLDSTYQDGYKQYGCFEYNASGDGLCRLAYDLYHSESRYKQSSINPSKTSAAEIFQEYENKDLLSVEVIKKAVHYWGKGVANLVSIFNPEKIIFGGGLFGPGLKFLDQIYTEAKRYAQPIAINHVELCAGKLGAQAQLFGAVRFLMNETS